MAQETRTRRCRESGDGRHELREVADDQVCPCCAKCGSVTLSIDSDDEAETTRSSGLHAGDGVFDHHRVGGSHAEVASGSEKRVRCGLAGQLALAGGHAIDDDVEAVDQGCSSEDGSGVGAR